MQHLFDPWFLCLCALGFPTDSQPIGFPGCVSIDFLEAHSFEPPGSPGAEIALEILAVHDHCLVLSKGSRCFRIHDFKRNIDRLRQVLLLVGRRRENLDELGPTLCDQCFQVFATNFDRHGKLLSNLRRENFAVVVGGTRHRGP